MASAAPEVQDTVEQNDAPVDYESRAREMGWTPKDDFKGDEKHWIDAETFVKRGEEMLPLVKAHNKRLERELADLKKQMKRSSEFFSQSEQRAYERALSDITKAQEEAVESGDLDAFRKAQKDADKLRDEHSKKVETAEDDAGQRDEDFADWCKANKWYATNAAMQAYADAQAGKIAKTKNGFLDRGDLDAVAEKVREKFEDAFPEEFRKADKPKPRSAVEGVTAPRAPRGGKTYNDLPAEAKAACDKWVRQGIIKSREDYVKSYNFG